MKKVKWSSLLEAIEFRRVIPIVGPELSVIELSGERPTLYDIVARELIQRLEWNNEPPAAGSSLDAVVRQYLRDPENETRRLYTSVHKIVNETKAWPTPEPLRQLASILHFDVFVTISFDSLLEQAINEVRFGGVDNTLTRVYSIARPLDKEDDDLPLAYKAEYQNKDEVPASPAVYHLFGKAGPVENDYTLREEDLLHFCQKLQSKDRRPENLFDLLNGRDLLLLGAAFPGWLTRFFLATAKQGRMFSGFPRPLQAGILADRQSPADEQLVRFLERNEAVLYPTDSVEFVAELYGHWNAKFPEGTGPVSSSVAPAPDSPEVRENRIFISYAREDQRHAEAIYNALTAKNLKVWLDRRELKYGSEFTPEIEQEIRRCSVFVPILSRTALSPSRRFLFREWNQALDLAKEWMPGSRFIQPVIVDDTKPDDLRAFPAFQSIDLAWLENGRVPEAFVSNMIDTIRARRSKALAL